MERKTTLPFGKKEKCGNFLVLKYAKSLSKADLKTLRSNAGIPADMRKHLQRGTLPYIKVEAISGIWAVEYCCNTQMYMVIDRLLPLAIEAAHNNEEAETSIADLAHLFAMMMTDTTVLGDEEYQKAKALALKGFMERQKASEISKEKDDEIVAALRGEEEARAAIVDMTKDKSGE